MSGPWSTVWDIASKRNATNEGNETLSDHALEVLQAFTMVEHAEAMSEALRTNARSLFG